MTSIGIFAHVLSLLHGLAAAFISIAVFYFAGLLLMPHRWPGLLRWADSVVLGLTFYVVMCWIATSARAIPVSYVMMVFGVVLWGLASLRFRWLQSTLGGPLLTHQAQRWLTDFSILYVLAYALVRPPAGSAVLTLSPEGSLDLVTYARHAKDLLAFGTSSVDLAPRDYFSSPASAFLLAWHSLPFLGDPLDAAVPALLMLAALFGMVVAGISTWLFGLSRRAALAIAAIALCAPMFRWTLGTYSLGELLAATAVMYLAAVIGASVASRITVPRCACLVAGGLLLHFAAPAFLESPGAVVSGIAAAVRYFSPLALFGLPSRASLIETAPDTLRPAAIVVLPFVALAWAAGAFVFRRSSIADRLGASEDRRLARALVVYVAAAVVIGNAAEQAIRSHEAPRWPGGWRQVGKMGRMPFRAVTVKVADEPNGLSTQLAMYYMPGRKTQVIGREVSSDELPFETVSRQQPMFIQNFGCVGVGHEDTVSAPGVGCLLMAPPSMTVGTSYPFNRTFLFIRYGRMTPREPGGRWNTHPTLNMRLTVDPQRVSLDREMYINFLVSPFLPEGSVPLRLAVRWGNGRHGEVALGEKQWLSFAVTSNDWSGNRLWNLPVSIEFPDGRTILFQELALTESPRGVIAQPVQPVL